MEDVLVTAPEAAVEIVDIQFRPGQKTYFFDPDGSSFAPGDHVIIDTARGAEFGTCVRGNRTVDPKDVVVPLRKVIRRASPQDERIAAENQQREKRACDICRQKIAVHKLDMQLVRAECAFDGSKILFYFTADERVDFRELVKDLASAFHTRIELRQIGVRDKAKLVGGLGICGRPFCCGEFLDDFQPVSIKMAKTQNLSLNPAKISGTCGRLMCCLKYEQDAYEALLRAVPKAESFVDTPEGRGTVTDVNLLRQQVKVRMEDAPDTVSVFPVEEIAVLRSGKAKKTDPPIPADLAPISGNGKRVRKEPEENAPVLESIRFRYSTESVADEVTVPTETEESRPNNRRRNRPEGRPQPPREPRESREQKDAAPKPQKNGPRPPRNPQKDPAQNRQKPPPQEKSTQNRAPKQALTQESGVPENAAVADASGEDRKPRRRNNYRHRRRFKAPQAPQN